MSQKFNYEFKLKVVLKFREGKLSAKKLAQEFEILNYRKIYKWNDSYQKRGLGGLTDNRGRKKEKINPKSDELKTREDLEKEMQFYKSRANFLEWKVELVEKHLASLSKISTNKEKT